MDEGLENGRGMMNRLCGMGLRGMVLLGVSWPVAAATLTLNPAMPMDRRVNVRVIRWRPTTVPMRPLLGDAAQASAIFDYVDQIWSQAGIDVSFDIRPTTYDDSFTLLGDPATITCGLVAI